MSMKRGKYENCVRALKFYGFSEEESKLACIKFLKDTEDNDESPFEMNLDFVDGEEIEDKLDRKKGESDEDCISRKIGIIKNEHPDWKHDKIVAVAHAYCGLSKKADAIELTNILKRSRSLDLAKFSRLIKEIKTQFKLKAPHMGILPQQVFLPMKNLNRLQTKLEKLVTQEEKWLTAEAYEQRKQYARYMRKDDSETDPMDAEEYTDAINKLSMAILEYFPNKTQEEAIDLAFEPTKGDNAWIMSNESEIISMNDGLNNIIKAPIILAKEMVQPYDVIDDNTGKTIREYHFKSYEELKAAADRFDDDDSLDIIIEHQDWYKTEHLMGVVKQIRGDDKSRSIRGMGYFYEKRLPKGLADSIKAGITIPVSIGFLAKLGEGGIWNNQEYNHIQKDILLRHLAICLDSIPRCPEGVCGINLEDSDDTSKMKIFSIIKKPNYYYNICNIFKDSKTETNTESSYKKQEKNQTMQEDSEGKLKGGDEPSDLEAVLTKLRKMLNNEGWTEELKTNAIARILSALGIKQKSDSTMEEKEFKDAIAKKESELEELRVELADAKDKIVKFEEEKRQDLIAKIKKFGDKYSDEELKDKDLSTLNIIADAVSKFVPSNEKPEVLPVTPKTDKKKLEDEMKGKRIDFSKVFEDVNKEFVIK